MRSSKYLPKIGTFNANKFWDNSFADARAKLLRLADVPIFGIFRGSHDAYKPNSA